MSHDELLRLLLPFGAALLGGALNSVAGGGSFLTFPALIFAGVPPLAANATSTVALWPGSVASTVGYRRELVSQRQRLMVMLPLSLLGGLIGAVTLVRTPPELFVRLVPFLLLGATLIFTFGDRINRSVGGRARGAIAVGALQLFISIYGGYFGGGMGLMMLAAFTLWGMTHLHEMNALKSALGVAINGVAIVAFTIAGQIQWQHGAVMIAGAIIGGFGGAWLARRYDSKKVKPLVILLGWAMTAVFFVRLLR